MTFICSVCRRDREQAASVIKLPCCCDTFILCQEVCAEMIPRVCRGMSVASYAAFFRKAHELTCQRKFKM